MTAQTQPEYKLELRGVSHWFTHEQTGEQVHALSDVDLRIKEGEFVTLVGPSGCGKTTLLNAVAGFIMPTQGTLLCDGAPITGPGTLDSLVEEQPELVEKLTLGILEGAQFVRQNPDQAAEILTSYVGGVEVRDVVEGNKQTSYDPRVSACTEKGVMDAAQALIDSGEIESEPFELQELLNVDMLTRLTEENPQFFEDLEPLPEDLSECQ